MKRVPPLLLVTGLVSCFHLSAQVADTSPGMHGFVAEFQQFSAPRPRVITEELRNMTPANFQQHPEFGVLPVDAPCTDCIELIQKRTADSRYYVEKGTNGGKFYVQAFGGVMNYTDAQGWLRAIDPDLQPAGGNIYKAPDMPSPTSLNAGDGTTTIEVQPGLSLHFNRNPAMYEITSAGTTQITGTPDFSGSSIGSDGMRSINIWPGVTREMVFTINTIETNYILNAAPALAPGSGWVAFNDEFTLPAGYVLVRDTITGGTVTSDGFWKGELLIVNTANGQEVARWSPIFAWDNGSARTTPPSCAYQLIANGNHYTVRTLVDKSWLLDPARVYPVTVDPAVSATATYTAGVIGFSAYAPGNGFCGSSSGFCLGGPLNVTFPGGATVTNVVWGASYRAYAPAWRSDGGFRMVGPCGEDPVNTNSWYSCAVLSAGICNGTGFVAPWLATCSTPSCSNTTLAFRIKNIDCAGWTGACSSLVLQIINSTWTVTVSGSTLETMGNTTTGNGAGTVTGSCCTSTSLSPSAANGVPGYTYLWSTGATTATINASSCTNGSFPYTCTVTDACGTVRTATVTLSVTNCVLPVELLNFDGTYDSYNKRVRLDWSTATEVNNNFFLVERTVDGVSFTTVGTVQSLARSGNSTSRLDYTFYDPSPLPGTSYYRLTQVDFSGERKNGGMVTIEAGEDESTSLTIQPNPANKSVSIGYLSGRQSVSIISLMDYNGRVVHSLDCDTQAGINNCEMDISTLPEGMYFVCVQTGDVFRYGKLVKQ